METIKGAKMKIGRAFEALGRGEFITISACERGLHYNLRAFGSAFGCITVHDATAFEILFDVLGIATKGVAEGKNNVAVFDETGDFAFLFDYITEVDADSFLILNKGMGEGLVNVFIVSGDPNNPGVRVEAMANVSFHLLPETVKDICQMYRIGIIITKTRGAI